MMIGANLEIPTDDDVVIPPIVDWMRSLTILHPAKGEIQFEPYDYQVECWLDRSPARLWLKPRQVGMSLAWALEALYYSIFYRNQRTLMLSKSQDDAQQLIAYARFALNYIPDDGPQGGRPALTRDNSSELEFENGSRIRSLPATKSAGRGFTANRVYCDEFAFAEYARDIYAAVRPTLSRGGHLTIGSTHDDDTTLFYELWEGQHGGEWSRHRIRWEECPEYDEAWYARERPNYTAQDWAREYGGEATTAGANLFDRLDIDACAVGWEGYQPWRPGRRYLSYWDVGSRQDATVGITLDISAPVHQVVAFERHLGWSYPAIQDAIEKRHRAYTGGVTAVESNGPGDPVIANLDIVAEELYMTERTKHQAITALQLAIEHGRLKFDIPELAGELRRYKRADKKLVQDCVMAAAGACYLADHIPVVSSSQFGSGGERASREATRW